MIDHLGVVALLFALAGCILMTIVSAALFDSAWLVAIFAFLTGMLLPTFLKLEKK